MVAVRGPRDTRGAPGRAGEPGVEGPRPRPRRARNAKAFFFFLRAPPSVSRRCDVYVLVAGGVYGTLTFECHSSRIEKGELCEWETRRGSEEEHGHAIDALTSTAPSHRTASDVLCQARGSAVPLSRTCQR